MKFGEHVRYGSSSVSEIHLPFNPWWGGGGPAQPINWAGQSPGRAPKVLGASSNFFFNLICYALNSHSTQVNCETALNAVSRKRRTNTLFDELSSDERLQHPELAFKTNVTGHCNLSASKSV